eukprot:1979686-Prymnesium_polylepis.2
MVNEAVWTSSAAKTRPVTPQPTTITSLLAGSSTGDAPTAESMAARAALAAESRSLGVMSLSRAPSCCVALVISLSIWNEYLPNSASNASRAEGSTLQTECSVGPAKESRALWMQSEYSSIVMRTSPGNEARRSGMRAPNPWPPTLDIWMA